MKKVLVVILALVGIALAVWFIFGHVWPHKSCFSEPVDTGMLGNPKRFDDRRLKTM